MNPRVTTTTQLPTRPSMRAQRAPWWILTAFLLATPGVALPVVQTMSWVCQKLIGLEIGPRILDRIVVTSAFAGMASPVFTFAAILVTLASGVERPARYIMWAICGSALLGSLYSWGLFSDVAFRFGR